MCQAFVLNARTGSAKHPFAEALAREPWDLAILSENQAADADFHPLAETDLVLIVRGGLQINSLEDAERLGAPIAVNAGYPADRILSRRVPPPLLVRVTEFGEEIELLHSKRADVLALARYHAQKLVDNEPAWRIAPRPFGAHRHGLATRAGSSLGESTRVFIGMAKQSGELEMLRRAAGYDGATIA